MICASGFGGWPVAGIFFEANFLPRQVLSNSAFKNAG